MSPSAGDASSSGGGIVGLRRSFSLSEGHILHSSVHLMTLQDTGSSFLVRLAHLYQVRGHGGHWGVMRPQIDMKQLRPSLHAVV